MSVEREIDVGSYVCDRHGHGVRGEVVAIHRDGRGAQYDIIDVRPFPHVWGAPQRCQRAVMMRPYPRPVPSRLDYADSPQGDTAYAAALVVCCAERDELIQPSIPERDALFNALEVLHTQVVDLTNKIAALHMTRPLPALDEAHKCAEKILHGMRLTARKMNNT